MCREKKRKNVLELVHIVFLKHINNNLKMKMNVYVLIVKYILNMNYIWYLFALCITVFESSIYNKRCTQNLVLKSYIHCLVQYQPLW